jgi:hypothetical protein
MSLTETPIPVLIKKGDFLSELNKFIEYCNGFYNIKDGIYPIATKDEIINAVGEYLTEPHQIEIQFDSIDREMVRKIIEPEYQF